ncbi:recombinase family protein [Streptomyces sp. NPDC048172]|uniref:recombinase family protein n=1 Tax=Streptomyces sp. NPDC048172 TaxID=3365505 RepID=UPI003720E7C5
MNFTAKLSDLAVSPFALPTTLLRGEVRAAWVGRTSTEEQQDPRQSMIRQLERARSALPEAWVLVCHFYDVESGRLELEARGHGTHYERFNIPIARDGGIADLLTEAQHPDRRFDVVICESTSRVARRMYENLTVERALERAGVPLFAWNEPIKLDGGRAQQILQRRINQSVAEYEVLNALEMSWGGLCTHVREGWNIGKPPYGYAAKTYRHPNPSRAAKGATKTRLEPDGVRSAAVTRMACWRHYERLGYGAIADRLNTDPERCPPPEPPGGPERARGAWSRSTVADILRNPKYTGYQVFNRRATKSRHGAHNDPALWIWSPEPAHEPLIPKWMFDAINARSRELERSRQGGRPNPHPLTRRTYVFQGRVRCACGRRMSGSHRPRRTYYTCWPKGNNRGRATRGTRRPSTSARTPCWTPSRPSSPTASSARTAAPCTPQTSPPSTSARPANAGPNENASGAHSPTSNGASGTYGDRRRNAPRATPSEQRCAPSTTSWKPNADRHGRTSAPWRRPHPSRRIPVASNSWTRCPASP